MFRFINNRSFIRLYYFNLARLVSGPKKERKEVSGDDEIRRKKVVIKKMKLLFLLCYNSTKYFDKLVLSFTRQLLLSIFHYDICLNFFKLIYLCIKIN